MTRAQLGVSCAHCGLAVPPALLAPEGEPSFCCSGCVTAHRIVHAGGLDQYYRLPEQRRRAVQSSGRSFEEFDHPAFAELYVQDSAPGRRVAELYLEGVHCASCVWLVERVPLLLDGVVRAELDVRRSLARIEWDPTQRSLAEIARTLDQLGYTPHPFRGVTRAAMRRQEDRAMLGRIGVAGALAGNVMLPALALYAGDLNGMESEYGRLFRWVSLALTIPALLFPGRIFFTGALAALRTRRLHMDLPIAIALGAGVVRGAINTITDVGPVYFDGVTVLIFLLLVGRFLQLRGQRAAADAAELLFSLAPSSARLVETDGSERVLPTAALLPDMLVRVQAGESFPADGTIVEGSSSVNAALLTGESRPITVTAHDLVHAGTLNISAPVIMRVVEAGSNSRLAQLLAQVEASSARRAPVVALADRLAGYFVASVLLLAGIAFALWIRHDSAAAWDNAIALLIVTCPCALALATPLAVTVAVGRAARAGIFIKGGDALELLARPGHLVLDKTGTVTEGHAALRHWQGDATVRPLVLALEAGSTHPVAEGFRRAWPTEVVPEADAVRHQVGGGIIGVVDGKAVLVGSPRFVQEQLGKIDATADADPTLTPVWVAVDGAVVARAGFGDRIRPSAQEAIDALRRRGWRTTLLSGDDPAVVAAVGAALGFDPDEAIGGATPEGKQALVEAWRSLGRTVVMVGDGVNDAAAIAAAHVGVGVHGGAEASLATADVHLTTAGLEPLVALVDGAARTFRVIRRNMAWALGYNAVGVTLAMTGTISPLVAAVLMPVSSLTVVLGSWLGRTFMPTIPSVADAPPVSAAAAVRAAA